MLNLPLNCRTNTNMHNFEYKETPVRLLTPEIVSMLSTLHEFKGKQQLYIEAEPDVLSSLLEIAKIQSTKSSNRIEGIYTSDKRLHELVTERSEPRNRSEQEIAGYREVLATIHENYDYMMPRPNNILQMHRDLYSFSSTAIGGVWKNSDNIIEEEKEDGTKLVRFEPVPAFLTPEAMQNLCDNFVKATEDGEHDPLLLIPMFILDFLCIHPFNDGNGRMSRLLTLLLLYRSGYIVGKYISVEMLIEKAKETYYEALKDSSTGWHDNENNYLPFVRYYLGVLIKAYTEFMDRVEHLHNHKLSKSDRIKEYFDRKIGKITKAEIADYCPDISITTIERTLSELVKSGYIEKVGVGRASGYVKK